MIAVFDLHSVCARCRDKKKGSDPCIGTPPASCSHCDALTAEQKAQLSTPSYKLKKEKKEAKSSTPAKASDTLSPTLVDPALVSVVGVVDGQTTSGLIGPAEKKKKTESKKLLCPPHWGVDILFLLFPASGIPLGFQTF